MRPGRGEFPPLSFPISMGSIIVLQVIQKINIIIMHIKCFMEMHFTLHI